MSNNQAGRVYPFAVVRLEKNWSAGALQWQAAITASTREELDQLMAEQVALYLYDCELQGQDPEAPKPEDELSLEPYRESDEPFDVVYVQPTSLSTASTAIEKALLDENVSKAELARRMNVPASTVSRITDPLYFGHTNNTLRAVADALGRDLEIHLKKRSTQPRRDHSSELNAH